MNPILNGYGFMGVFLS